MPSQDPSELHAVLAPSAAERWSHCPASVLATAHLTESAPESEYAAEGTAYHALIFIEASHHLLAVDVTDYKRQLTKWRRQYGARFDVEAMYKHAAEYVDFLRERLKKTPGSYLMLEQRVDCGLPQSWGTADALIISPTTVHVIDAKYGVGVRVQVQKNPQLRLYAVGALDEYDMLGEVETVMATVFQPRLDHIATEVISADDLRAWREDLRPVAKLALEPGAPFGPSEEACRWCPLSGKCVAQAAYFTELDFGTPAGEMTPEQIGEALEMLPGMRSWIEAVEKQALQMMYREATPIPGWKTVLGNGRRFIKDSEAATEALELLGYEREEIGNWKLGGIGDLEKLLGKKEFAQTLAPFISKTEGNPAVVKENDPRPPVSSLAQAAIDFAEEAE